MDESPQTVVNRLEKRYPGWVFIAGETEEDTVCIAAISPEREPCMQNLAFDWSPCIRLCGDSTKELEIAFAFSIGNRTYDGMILVPQHNAIFSDNPWSESWNPFGQDLQPIMDDKPLPTVEH